MRTKRHWTAHLQREDGQTVNHPVETFWDPKAEDAAEAVARTAAAEATVKHPQRMKHVGLSASRVESDDHQVAA